MMKLNQKERIMTHHKIHILGGGTVNHVRSHFALSAPAYGQTARALGRLFKDMGEDVTLHLTKMANSGLGSLETNADISARVDELIADPETKMIVFNAAIADFEGQVGDVPSGKYADRLQSRGGDGAQLTLRTAEKIIQKIRKHRKDIFLVAFKTTTGATHDEQYMKALGLMKETSANLVLANDTVTRQNMVVTPEEARYFVGNDRGAALAGLARMAQARSGLTFTRSSVLNDEALVAWNSPQIPDNLRTIVNHLIASGIYQPFRGKTVGHFAARGVKPDEFLTSIRRSNFNRLHETGLVRVEALGDDRVIAHGAKPSVGGQSQRIIFSQHEDLDAIVHFHGELRSDARDAVPVRPQWMYECGSHECGRNTADGLVELRPGIHAVMLENHGPNIVFSRAVNPQDVISFIEDNFDLSQKTGGNILPEYRYAA